MVLYLTVAGYQERTLKRTISSILVLALGIILAYHFVLFWIQGHVIIAEPNKVALFLETLLSFGIIAFGIERVLRS